MFSDSDKEHSLEGLDQLLKQNPRIAGVRKGWKKEEDGQRHAGWKKGAGIVRQRA